MRRGCWWIAISMVFACGGGREPAPVEMNDVPRSVDQLEPWLDAARARSRDAHCERPLLGGEPIEGRADEAMLVLIDQQGGAGPCLAAVHETRAERQRLKPKRPKDAIIGLPTPHGDTLTTIARACEAVPALVDDAIRHRDACAPLRPGARELDYDRRQDWLRLAYGVDAHAAQLAATGDAAAAVLALLDGIRLMHDLRRGPASFLEAMLAVAGETVMMERLAVLLAEHRLPREALDDVAARLEVLWNTRPQLADLIEGERIASLESVAGNEFEFVVWRLTAEAGQFDRLKEACPAGSTLAACQRDLAALAGDDHPRTADTVLPWLFLRATTVDYLLAGLRIHVATLRSTGCEPSTVPPVLLSPPELGETIEVRGSDLTIPYRPHLVLRGKPWPIVVWRVRCPAAP